MDALDEYGSSDNESAGAPASNAVPAALTSPPGSPSTRNAAQAPSTRNAAQAAEVLLRPVCWDTVLRAALGASQVQEVLGPALHREQLGVTYTVAADTVKNGCQNHGTARIMPDDHLL